MSTIRRDDNPYEELRARALAVSPSEIGVTVDADEVWGVLMDLPISDATATIVAFADGSASIYLSSGDGFIGGGEQRPVRAAAERLVGAAQDVRDRFTAATAYRLPSRGQIRFHARTGTGVSQTQANEADLQSGDHPLSALYAAGQEVITAYQQVDR